MEKQVDNTLKMGLTSVYQNSAFLHFVLTERQKGTNQKTFFERLQKNKVPTYVVFNHLFPLLEERRVGPTNIRQIIPYILFLVKKQYLCKIAALSVF